MNFKLLNATPYSYSRFSRFIFRDILHRFMMMMLRSALLHTNVCISALFGTSVISLGNGNVFRTCQLLLDVSKCCMLNVPWKLRLITSFDLVHVLTSTKDGSISRNNTSTPRIDRNVSVVSLVFKPPCRDTANTCIHRKNPASNTKNIIPLMSVKQWFKFRIAIGSYAYVQRLWVSKK